MMMMMMTIIMMMVMVMIIIIDNEAVKDPRPLVSGADRSHVSRL